MDGDKRDVEPKGSKIYLFATLFMLSTATLTYVVGDLTYKNHTVSKAAFICTMIEQKGKNMDDVVCVQYTHQKLHKEVVAMNKLAAR
jgi:hypothetical protein